jgi:beta-D-xylosidase 4
MWGKMNVNVNVIYTTVLFLVTVIAATTVPSSPYMTKCTSPHPYCDSTLSPIDRSKNLVSLLTLDEKISQLSTNSFTNTYNGFVPGIPRLGVPEYNYHTEGLHGIRNSDVAGFTNSTLFPQVTGMAATGNLTLIREMGVAMAYEMRAVNNVMRATGKIVTRGGGLGLYGPTINIIRDGRWGRNQESVSEDPWLSGQYSANFIEGVQGNDGGVLKNNEYIATAATCKHLDAYSQETNRHDSNAKVSMLDLMETYLPQFEACVASGAAQIMCSYNKINNIPACLSGDIQNGIVREKWRFNGSIVSDCDAIKDINVTQKTMTGPQATAAGLDSGCDQDCGNFYGLWAKEALDSGLLNITTIDRALERIFLMRFKLGEFGDISSWNHVKPDVVGSTSHFQLALQAARESISLLRNDLNILPITLNKTIGLIGPLANDSAVMEGSKQDYRTAHIVSVLEGMKSITAGAGVNAGKLTYSAGLRNVTDNDKHSKMYLDAVKVATDVDVAILVVGIDGSIEAEAKDRSNVVLPGAQESLVRDVAAARAKVGKTSDMIIVLINGGPISFDWLKFQRDVNIGVLEAFEGGQSGGTALAETIYGKNNPSGVLPYSVYYENATIESVVPFTKFDMRPDGNYPGRTYRFSVAATLWEFGFGLSYTTFQLDWSFNNENELVGIHDVNSGVQHCVKVTNTGKVAGAKVVHAFVTRQYGRSHKSVNAPSPPIKSLYGMKKIYLDPGESKMITFSTASQAGSKPFYTTLRNGTQVLLPGDVTITIGVGVGKIEKKMTIVGSEKSMYVPLRAQSDCTSGN